MLNILSVATETATNLPPEEPMWVQFAPLIVVFVLFYFLLIRPQQKAQKQHQMMVDSISKGDEVITSGGILGKVKKVEDQHLEVEIADKVSVRVVRSSVKQNNSNKQDAANQNDKK